MKIRDIQSTDGKGTCKQHMLVSVAGTTQDLGYITFATSIFKVSQKKILQVINQWILQVFMDGLQGKWEQDSWLC